MDSQHYSSYMTWTTTIPTAQSSVLSSVSGHSLPSPSQQQAPIVSQAMPPAMYLPQTPHAQAQQQQQQAQQESSINSFYQDYNAQISNLKKKHLQEQQELEQRLLLQKQELERILSNQQSQQSQQQSQQQQQYYSPSSFSQAPNTSSAPTSSTSNSLNNISSPGNQRMSLMDSYAEQKQNRGGGGNNAAFVDALGNFQMDSSSGSDPYSNNNPQNNNNNQQQSQSQQMASLFANNSPASSSGPSFSTSFSSSSSSASAAANHPSASHQNTSSMNSSNNTNSNTASLNSNNNNGGGSTLLEEALAQAQAQVQAQQVQIQQAQQQVHAQQQQQHQVQQQQQARQQVQQQVQQQQQAKAAQQAQRDKDQAQIQAHQMQQQQHIQQQEQQVLLTRQHERRHSQQGQMQLQQESQDILSSSSSSSATVMPTGNNTSGGPSLIQAKAAASRHVSSVISHFTANSDGYKRLAQELDGFLFILSSTGIIIFASNSCAAYFGLRNSSMLGQSIGIYLHPDDEKSVMSKLVEAFKLGNSISVFCRFKRFQANLPGRDPTGGQGRQMDSAERSRWEENHQMLDTVLMEMTGRPVYEKGDPIPVFVVNVGREYRSKSTDEMDAILTLRLENIKLKLHLKAELEKHGLNSSLHPLLHGDATGGTGAGSNGQFPTPLGSSGSSRSSSSAEPQTSVTNRSVSSSVGSPFDGSSVAVSGGFTSMPPPTSSSLTLPVSDSHLLSFSSLSETSPPSSLMISSAGRHPVSGAVGESPLSVSVLGSSATPSSSGVPSVQHRSTASMESSTATSSLGPSGISQRVPSVGGTVSSKKRKKAKIPIDELVCRQCGTTASPEWRRGPDGPKTLCNACGLLYAKKVKIAKAAALDIT